MKKRNTQSKQEVLTILQSAQSAVSHEMIQDALTSSMDRATIYRILKSFCNDGLVHRICGDDGKQYFAYCHNCTEMQHKHNHYHFRCTECGTVECMPQELDIVLPNGYSSDSINAVIAGRCGRCATG